MNLGIENHLPQLLGRHLLHGEILTLISTVELIELVSPAVGKSRARVWAEHGPIPVLLDTLHEEVGNPKTIKEIASTLIVIARVELETQEFLNIRMPRLQVDCKGSISLTSLIHILCGIVKYLQHRRDARRLAVRALDLRTAGTDVMDGQPYATGPLGDLGTLCEGLVDTLD